MQKGFTLIEIAILMVIIGLIAGSILIGRDLLKAAAIHAQVAQIRGYVTAMNVFRTKYQALPGDMASSKAIAYGMAFGDGSECHGDGNEVLCPCTVNDSTTAFGCETGLVWSHLSYAKIIDAEFTSINSQSDINYVDTGNVQTISYYLPQGKLDSSLFIHAFGVSIPGSAEYGKNFLFLGNISDIDHGVLVIAPGLFPADLYAIDSKMDDGLPMTGSVVSREGIDVDTPSVPDVAKCVAPIIGNPYNIKGDVANQPLCNARFEM